MGADHFQTPDARSIGQLAQEYDALLKKLDEIVSEASSKGEQLVSANPTTMKIRTTLSGGNLTIRGIAVDSASLRLAPAGSSWQDPATIQAALAATSQALARLGQSSEIFASTVLALEAAEAFNQCDALDFPAK